MASSQSVADFIVGQIQTAGRVSSKKMFGEYAIYVDGKVVALVCDDLLFMKPTPAGKQFLGADAKEGIPYPNAKPCFLISGEKWDEREWLTELFKISAQQLLPPKKKAVSKKRVSSGYE